MLVREGATEPKCSTFRSITLLYYSYLHHDSLLEKPLKPLRGDWFDGARVVGRDGFEGVNCGLSIDNTIHKEFVSSKIAGDVASLTDPALDRILEFAAEAGLIVILHNDVDRPLAAQGAEPVFLTQVKDLFRRHPRTTIIWAHVGLGRIVQPVENHAAMLETMLSEPAFSHVYFDISWDEVAKYILATPESTRRSAELVNRYPDRFLFGSDTVAPSTPEKYFAVFDLYTPLWDQLTEDASRKVRMGNYERLFDEARRRVRAWEKANAK